MLYLDIIYNLSLLVALSVLSGFIGQKRQLSESTRSLLQGLVFGAIAIIGMLYPLILAPGVIFDGRSVVISLCGLFFGPLPAVIAAGMALAVRFLIGGAGILTGTLVIAASALTGILFHRKFFLRGHTISSRELLLLGFTVHVIMFLLMFTFPYATAVDVIRNLGLPILTVYPLATLMIGKIIGDNLDKARYTERLAASEEKYRRIADNMSDVIWTTDLDGRITYISPSVHRMLGLTADQVIDRTIDDLFPPDSSRILRAVIDDERIIELDPTSDPHRARYGEVEFRRTDGVVLWVSLSATMLRDGRGEAIGFQGVLRDVTNRKQWELDLRTAKEKAEESDRLKTAFLLNMSHEIRTPMNGIIGFLSLLAEPDLEEESKKEYIDIVNTSGSRLLTTINDIIEISRIEAGAMEVVTEFVDVRDVMESLVGFFQPAAMAKQLSLRITAMVAADNAVIRTDRHKLEGALGNLINNAIKFTEAGEIDLGNELRDGYMVFTVRDTGCGIPPERLDAVFDRFVQVDMRMTRKHEGSGLGLSIVKAYIGALGGTVTVSSILGEGSTFSFSIPLTTQDVAD